MASRSSLFRLGVVMAMAACCGAVPRAWGQGGAGAQDQGAKEDEAKKDSIVTTEHTLAVGDRVLRYVATAGTMTLPSYEGKPRAEIFHVTYTLLGEGGEGGEDGQAIDPATRPVTFAFNGGPGSSSVWLHLGALGPMRVKLDDEGMPGPPPFVLVENPETWLAFTDLVFIDPVSTGYSRAAEGVDPRQFHGLEEDLWAVGEFIRLWTTRNARWGSPKFLAGESYGTTRAAGLSLHLLNDHGMALNGIVLISPVLDFGSIRFDPGNDRAYIGILPSYALTARYHGAIGAGAGVPREFEGFKRGVEAFAAGEYALALAAGDRLTPERKREVAAEVARWTGLSAEFVERSDLRVALPAFAKQLLIERRRTVGRLDSRYTGIDADQAGASYEHDPSYSAILAPYTACLYDYVRRTLKYESDAPYEILTGRVHPWSFAHHQNQYANVATRLRDAMHRSPSMRVLVACGHYDLATPYFAAEDVMAHADIDPSLRGNVAFTYYDAGHMMYVRVEDLKKLAADARAFYEGK